MNREVLLEKEMVFKVDKPIFEVEEFSSQVALETTSTFDFRVVNKGNQGGFVKVIFDLPGIFRGERSYFLRGGETTDCPFEAVIPSDLEEGKYIAHLWLNGKRRDFSFYLKGLKVEAQASFDKSCYLPGEEAELYLDITNLCERRPVELVARVQKGKFKEEKKFSLEDRESLSFLLPVGDRENSVVTYGIYTGTGRAIYLNTIYLPIKRKEFSLKLNKTRFKAGETVEVSVNSSEEGTLTVWGDFVSKKLYIKDPTSFQFALPPTLKSGTYSLSYSFNGNCFTIYYDVDGIKLQIFEAQLDKSSYAPNDALTLQLRIQANQPLYGIVVGTIGEKVIFEKRVTLKEGLNELFLKGKVPSDVNMFNVLKYSIREESSGEELVGGEEYFNLAGPLLFSAAPGKLHYGKGEKALIELAIGGKGLAKIQGYVDDELCFTRKVYVDGDRSVSFQTRPLKDGVHSVRIVLWVGGRKVEKEFNFGVGNLLAGEFSHSKRVIRISGESRIETAIKISKESFSKADYVVIATAYNFPDALAGTPLAYVCEAPLLLTKADSLPESVKNEIKRLGAKKVIILGGTLAISSKVEASLKSMGLIVTRISGKNRYETAKKIAEKLRKEKGEPDKVFIVRGDTYPDALSSSSYAAYFSYPILLTSKNNLSDEVKDYLKSLSVKPEAKILGGSLAVSPPVEAELKNILTPSKVKRVSGRTRIDTSIEVAKEAKREGFTYCFPLISTGYNYPDALTGGVLGAKKKSPIILTSRDTLSAETESFLASNKDDVMDLYILGGRNAVSSDVKERIEKIIE